MTKRKEIKKEEMENVNGGYMPSTDMVMCPKCYKNFSGLKNRVFEGSGCSEKAYFVCPHCGHKF